MDCRNLPQIKKAASEMSTAQRYSFTNLKQCGGPYPAQSNPHFVLGNV